MNPSLLHLLLETKRRRIGMFAGMVANAVKIGRIGAGSIPFSPHIQIGLCVGQHFCCIAVGHTH